MSKDHCAYPKCGKELTHIEGRKKKKYCDQNCNTRHWKMLHPTYKPKHKMIELEAFEKLTALAKATPLGQKIMEEISKKPLTFKVRDISPKGEVLREHEIKYSVADKKSFDGKRMDNYTLDEPGQYKKPSENIQSQIQERITQIEKDLLLPSKYLLKEKRTKLQTELAELKKLNN